MKLCVIGTRGFPQVEGGVEKHCESIYPLMAKNSNMDITVFRRKPYVKGAAKEFENVRFVDLPSTRIKGFEAVLHSFLACIYAIKMRPDAVHIHNIGPCLFAPLLKWSGIPVVMTYHSANYEHKKWGSGAQKLLRFCERIALKYADRIIFVSRFQMEKYPDDVQKKSVYIPNGVQRPVVTEKQNCLEKHGLEPEKYILSVGRITPEKGFHTLIEAFLKQYKPGWKLVIAGGVEFESGYMKQLQALSEGIPVVFTGYVFGEELAQLYANAGLYVLASENEGFPLVLLEAMSYRRNLLVSDIPATQLIDLEQQDYFPCGDAAALAEKLAEKTMKPAERTYDLSAYEWQNVADRLSRVIAEAVR